MSRKKTEEEIRTEFRSLGWKLVGSYIGATVRCQWKCVRGGCLRTLMTGDLRDNPKCRACFKFDITVEDMHQLAARRGYTYLDSEYLGNKYKHNWRCGLGHEFKSCRNDIDQGRGCPICGRVKSAEAARKSNEARRKFTPLEKRIVRAMRSRLAQIIRKGKGIRTGSAIRDLGCSLPELFKHIESQWLPGMNWDNWGPADKKKRHWQIDHVDGLKGKNMSDRPTFLRSFHYSNLQPLWWLDNILKG